MLSEQKNFLGMPSHPTDELLHWRDKVADALKLRAAYDAIIAAFPDADPHIQVLTSAAYSNGEHSEAETHAGESM